MKTVQFFDHSIKRLLDEVSQPNARFTKGEIKNIKNRIAYFKLCRDYLESNPTEVFVRSEITRLENFISAKDIEFSDYNDVSKLPKPIATEIKKKFEEQYGVPHKRKQLSCLRFIVD